MVVKKKTTKHVEDEKEHVLMEDEAREERRPPITQVVEVVEDAGDSDVVSVEASSDSGMLEDETPGSMEEETRGEEAEESPSQNEKRRVLVDELFQKKDESMKHDVMPEISMHKRPSTKPMFMWAIVIIMICVVVGGTIFLASSGNLKMPSFGAKPTPTATPTVAPTPTPVPVEVKKETLKIQVLNGSGTPGVAGKMKTFLETKGYKVADTGNADNYDYETTEIQVKSGKDAIFTALETDMKEEYSLSSSPEELSEDVPYDVRIIIGKE